MPRPEQGPEAVGTKQRLSSLLNLVGETTDKLFLI